ncbi:MAG: SIR2 family protein, partial [Planctomycetota bacterium]
MARIPFAGVVTTNYDKLLERAWRMEQSGEPKVLTHLDAPALGKLLLGGDYFVLKAHGDIDRPKSIVLTAKDYQEVIHSNSAFESVFSAILLTRVILFVGYSLNDPDFGLLLERPLRRFEGLVPPRYALMTDIGPIEADVLYRTSGVQVIPYDNADGTHQEVIGFLKQLEEGTTAARARTAAVKEAPRAQVFQTVPPPTQQVNIELGYDGAQVISALSHGRDRTFGSARAVPNWRGLRVAVQLTMKAWDGKPATVTPLGTALTEMVDDGIVEYLKGLPGDTVVNLRIGQELRDLPWEWIQVPDPDGPRFLSQRNPVVRQLLNAWESPVYAGFGSPLKVLLVADTTLEMPLPGAREEAKRIGAMFGQKGAQITLLLGAEATYQNLAESIRSQRYDIIHFAGHAWFDAQTSYLMLTNEEVLRAPQLGDLIRSEPPAVLFLNSHFTSFVPRGMEAVAAKATAETFSSTGSGYLGFSQIAA